MTSGVTVSAAATHAAEVKEIVLRLLDQTNAGMTETRYSVAKLTALDAALAELQRAAEQTEGEKEWGRRQADLLTDCATDCEAAEERVRQLEAALRDLLFFAENVPLWDHNDPTGEGREIRGESCATARALLGSVAAQEGGQ